MTNSSNINHLLSAQDWSDGQIEALLERAEGLRSGQHSDALKGRSVGLLFFASSLRTRCSFEIGVSQLGGHSVTLQPGKDAWPMELDLEGVMDGDAEEHVIEAARVLSRYFDMIGIRVFPRLENWAREREDQQIRAFADHAGVPIINMETIVHPCQALAMAMTLRQRLGKARKRKFVLTWAYHPKPLNTAVANSALMMATRMGHEVTLLCPTEEYLLDERYLESARDNAQKSGGSLSISHDPDSAYQDAEVVYAKSWGALPYAGRWEQEKELRDRYRHFMVDEAKMSRTANGLFSHCLPMRRNMIASSEVIDGPRSLCIDEAENRLHVQKAIMEQLVGSQAGGAA